jgi:uncharacterized protein (DUF697 family)
MAMHDIDGTQLEFESDLDAFEFNPGINGQAYESEAGVFDDADEMELAAELLAVSDESELDQFLGKLIGQAGQAIGKAVKGPVGKTLGGLLKGAVKKVLPAAAGAVGGMVGGPAGAAVASSLATAAGKAFGLELEGMSTEDQEFETARRFVRFAGEAARQAAQQAGRIAASADPQAAAKKAVIGAASKLAPGLLRPVAHALQSEVAPPQARAARPQGDRPGHSGRWVRQGQQIVLLGA